MARSRDDAGAADAISPASLSSRRARRHYAPRTPPEPPMMKVDVVFGHRRPLALDDPQATWAGESAACANQWAGPFDHGDRGKRSLAERAPGQNALASNQLPLSVQKSCLPCPSAAAWPEAPRPQPRADLRASRSRKETTSIGRETAERYNPLLSWRHDHACRAAATIFSRNNRRLLIKVRSGPISSAPSMVNQARACHPAW